MPAAAGARATAGRPASILRPNPNWTKLFYSLLIDFIGLLSFLAFPLSEALDVLWAPISAYLISGHLPTDLYGMTSLSLLGFVEELLPGLDFIPTATIGWLAENTTLVPILSARFENRRQAQGR